MTGKESTTPFASRQVSDSIFVPRLAILRRPCHLAPQAGLLVRSAHSRPAFHRSPSSISGESVHPHLRPLSRGAREPRARVLLHLRYAARRQRLSRLLGRVRVFL